MVFVTHPQRMMQDTTWFDRFGTVVSTFDEIVPLHFTHWSWCVKRVLYADQRDMDFSILPYDHLDEVLSVNRDIIAKGCQVLYDACGDLLERKIGALLESAPPQTAALPSEAELRQVIGELLYHIIWAFKKIKRGELWVAANCINTHMKNLLLRLIEAHTLLIRQAPDVLQYSGRFLEQRADPAILADLQYCFTHYDRADAIAALGHLFEITKTLSEAICEKTGYPFDAAQFESIQKMFQEMQSTP
jgi:aminoglycoside 6-adenylyltransferase